MTFAIAAIMCSVIVPTVSADTWDVTGTWFIDVEYLGIDYPEKLILTQDGTAITGVSLDLVPYNPGSHFVVYDGSVVGNDIDIYMNKGSLVVHMDGAIAADGSISGTWADEAPGTRKGTWVTTSGSAFLVDTTAPVVTINSPSDGSLVSGTVDIHGSIVEDIELSHYNIAIYPGDADFMDFSKRLEQATVSQSSGFVDQSIYQWDTTTYPNGEYLIRLAARDKAGNRDLSGSPYLGGDDSQHVIKVIVLNDKVVHGGGHMLEELKLGDKRKDWLDISFGGLVGDAGTAGLVGNWQINFHNVDDPAFDNSRFHTTEITDLNFFVGNSPTCTEAMNFYANGELNGVPGYSIIFRAGDSSDPSSYDTDTVRVQLFCSGVAVYDTHTTGEFNDESNCVGTARTGLDTGNIVIQG